MKIVVDATVLARPEPTGIDYYTRSVIQATSTKMLKDNIELAYLATMKRDLGVAGSNIKIKRYLPFPERFYSGLLHYLNIIPFDVLSRTRGDVYIFPNFSRPHLLGRAKSITFIYDLAFARLDAINTTRHKKFLDKEIKGAIKRSSRIVVCSESTKNDLVDIYGVNRDRVDVVYPAVDHSTYKPQSEGVVSRVINRYKIVKKYILYLGTIEPRKNITALMRAYAELPGEIKSEYSLVLAGGKGWMDEEIEAVFDALSRENSIIRTGYVEDKDKPGLYSGASLFVFPSLYEGFGMPVLEAMACGVPIITSDISSLPEVVGKDGVMVDPVDESGMRDQMAKILKNPKLAESLRQYGLKQAARFSWDSSGKKLAEIIRSVQEIEK